MDEYYTMPLPATEPGTWNIRRDRASLREQGANCVPLEIRDAVLIVNPRAGSGRRMHQLDEARRILSGSGMETELQHTEASGEAVFLARRAVQQSRQFVIVCGGDGTINEAVNGLAGSKVPLGVLPAGTANILAKDLSIPWNLPRAARRLLGSRLRRIALGLAVPAKSSGEPRYFVSVAGAGADAAVVAAVNPQVKDQAGILAYWHQGFRQLLKYDFPRFRVQTAERALDASLVIVGRTKHYGGPFQITTEADLLQPQFELAVVTTRSRWRYLAYLPVLWAGRLRRARHVQFWKTTSVECVAVDSHDVKIQVDGEPAGQLPAKFWVVPDALTLAVPDPM
jgi:diacylglycerol kinase (ATP)